jgi:hypothetical protein
MARGGKQLKVTSLIWKSSAIAIGIVVGTMACSLIIVCLLLIVVPRAVNAGVPSILDLATIVHIGIAMGSVVAGLVAAIDVVTIATRFNFRYKAAIYALVSSCIFLVVSSTILFKYTLRKPEFFVLDVVLIFLSTLLAGRLWNHR